MNPKQQTTIDASLTTLESGAFATLEVQHFYSSLRALASGGPVKEIADFAAHQEGRTFGPVQRWIQLKALQLRIVIASHRGKPATHLNMAELEKVFYEDVIRYAIKQTQRWPMPSGMTRDAALRLLDSFYFPLGSSVYLRPLTLAEQKQLEALLNHVLAVADFVGNPVLSSKDILGATADLLKRLDKRHGSAWEPRFAALRKTREQELACCFIEVVHGVHYKLWTGENVSTRIVHWSDGVSVSADIPVDESHVCIVALSTDLHADRHFPQLIEVGGTTSEVVRAIREPTGALILHVLGVDTAV